MAFWGQVIIYLIRFIILGAAALAGILVGKNVRAKKDAKGE